MTLAPVDPILGTTQAYKADKDPSKMNLGVGAYRTEEEKPYVFQIVRQVEKELLEQLNSNKINKEYIPIDGHEGYVKATKKLLFGDCPNESNIVTVQSISGTGALRVGGEFIRKFLLAKIHLPKPTWGNHKAIFQSSYLQVGEYPYYNPKGKNFDKDGMLNYLNTLPEGDIVLLHACAHNPTGVDPSHHDWKQIAEVVQRRKLIPFFDSAYQGFASGDLEYDAFSIRYFNSLGIQMLVAQSFAKNMGLYGERIGALHVVCSDQNTAKNVLSQIKLFIRQMYSSPPVHGALIVHRILSNAEYYQRWKDELKAVSNRILEVRGLLRKNLEELRAPGTWNHITDQIGMFSYTGLSEKVCVNLIEKHHIYLLKNGRISLVRSILF